MAKPLNPINVWLAGRSYRIRISGDEEAAVRKAVKKADEKVAELRQHYAGKDDQDFVAMCLLMYATDTAASPGEHLLRDDLATLIKKLDDALAKDDL